MEKYTALYSIGSVLFSLSIFLILFAGILILIKKRTLGSILIITGSLVYILISVFGFVGFIFAAQKSPEDLLLVNGLISVSKGFSFLILSIGILVHIVGIKKTN